MARRGPMPRREPGAPTPTTTEPRRPLTPAEAGRLGGLTTAHRMTPEERIARATKGGYGTRDKHGLVHYVRMAYKRADRLA